MIRIFLADTKFSLLIKLSISSSAQSHSFDQKSPLLIKIIFKVDYFPLNRNEIYFLSLKAHKIPDDTFQSLETRLQETFKY